MSAKSTRGSRTIYLLHFCTVDGQTARYQHAGHYLGSTDRLTRRLKEHRMGQGANLMAWVKFWGLSFHVVRTWRGTRADERAMKYLADGRSRGSLARLCPVCRGEVSLERCARKWARWDHYAPERDSLGNVFPGIKRAEVKREEPRGESCPEDTSASVPASAAESPSPIIRSPFHPCPSMTPDIPIRAATGNPSAGNVCIV